MKDCQSGVLIVILYVLFSSTDSQIQIYRYGMRDIFKNPDYTSFEDCPLDTCKAYNANCVEDGNCCLCRCTQKFSTYNLTKGRCVSDKEVRSGSRFRFVKNGQILPKIQLQRLTRVKKLGQLSLVRGVQPLKNCSVAMHLSKYWAEDQYGKWRPLTQLTNDTLFEINHEKNDVILKWTLADLTQETKFHGLILRLAIQCFEVNSTIVFKTWKDYNGGDFIGCLTPDLSLQPFTIPLTCSSLVPRSCKRYCRALGRSVAIITHGTKCSCLDGAQIKTWNRTRFSCGMPCPGDPSKFCGGKETYSVYRSMPEWPNDFKFSPNGTLDSKYYRCIGITEPRDSTFWNNSYFCSKRVGLPFRVTWSSRGRKNRLLRRRCIRITEPEEASSSSWNDNFLCVRQRAGLYFHWSHAGPLIGKQCIPWHADDPHGWNDNFLCADRPNRTEVDVSLFCASHTGLSPRKTISPATTSQSFYVKPSYWRISTTSSTNSSSSTPFVSEIPQKINEDSDDDYVVVAYVLIPFICIFCGFLVGILTIMHLKRRRMTPNTNAPFVIDFVNRGGTFDKDSTLSSSTQLCPRRKSRTDSLPSLPSLTGYEEPDLIRQQTIDPSDHPSMLTYPRRRSQVDRLPSLPNSAKLQQPDLLNTSSNSLKNFPCHWSTTDECSETRTSDADGELLETEQNFYEVAEGVISDCDAGSFCEIIPEIEAETQDKVSENSPGLCRSSTYESISIYLEPDSLYLEVLP